MNGVGATAGTPGTTGTQPQRAPSGTLGKDDFLKLLVGQLQNQDPLEPTSNNEWMGQMAQFTQLEQISNMAKSNERIAESLSVTQALGLIGRSVSYTDAAGDTVDGKVEKVDTGGGKTTLTIAGVPGIDASAVTQVR